MSGPARSTNIGEGQAHSHNLPEGPAANEYGEYVRSEPIGVIILSINSPRIHNDLVLELTENLFEVTDGPNGSAMTIVESIAVRVIILCARENGIDKKLLLKTFLDGVKNRVMDEDLIILNS